MAKYRDFDDDLSLEDDYQKKYDDKEFNDELDELDDLKELKELDDLKSDESKEHIVRSNREEYAVRKKKIQQQTSKSTVSGSKKKKKSKSRLWVLVLIIVVEAIIIAGLLFMWYVVRRVSSIPKYEIHENEVQTNPDIKEDTVEVLKGYTNILLLGSDARNNSLENLVKREENLTDAILIASINNDTKEVRILSVYRDSLFEISDPEKGIDSDTTCIQKANEGTFRYAIEGGLSMINRNLDLTISDFVMINWSGLIDIVDAVGGVDIAITQMEQRWLNRYLVDTSNNTGVTYTEVTTYEDDPVALPDSVLQADTEKMETRIMTHLDGIQATAFARVRYGDGKADYGRTARQRAVISQIISKAKNLSNINSVITSVCENLVTSLSTNEILRLAPSMLKYKLTMIEGGFPFEKNDQIEYSPVWAELTPEELTSPIIPVTLESNVIKLHELLFDDYNYKPSETVKEISAQIEKFNVSEDSANQ